MKIPSILIIFLFSQIHLIFTSSPKKETTKTFSELIKKSSNSEFKTFDLNNKKSSDPVENLRLSYGESTDYEEVQVELPEIPLNKNSSKTADNITKYFEKLTENRIDKETAKKIEPDILKKIGYYSWEKENSLEKPESPKTSLFQSLL